MNSRGILLVPSPNVINGELQMYLPYGLLALRAVGHAVNARVDVLRLPIDGMSGFGSSAELAEAMLAHVELRAYDTIGLSTICNSFHHSVHFAKLVKQRAPHIQIWMGGPHASALAQRLLDAFVEVDAVFVGEAEGTLAEVLGRRARGDFSVDGVPGVLTRQSEFIPRPILANLDELPFVHVDDFVQDGVPKPQQVELLSAWPVEVARGCPGRCTFCSTRGFWGKSVRWKSDERIIGEMRALKQRIGYDAFGFIGDNLGSPLPRLMQFCSSMIEFGAGLTWRADIKLDHLTKETLGTLWRAGCRGFFVGLESASQTTLNRVRKGIVLSRALDVIRHAVEMGFRVETSFIVGFPWEGVDDVRETIHLHRDLLALGVDRSAVWILCPLSSTNLLKEYPVHFDHLRSSFALDGVPMDAATRELVHQHPDLFVQFGRYENGQLPAVELDAARETAAQLSVLFATT